MKMVKSLLLGTAAGLVVVTAGQAAELPVKAKPVEYVKICTLYGAGFYYMPGTDMCIKIGGWVRAEVTDESNGNLAGSPLHLNSNTRATNNLGVRARGYITADAREQTAYGVARAYIDVGVSGTLGNGGSPAAPGLASNTNRAFLQWAGFTAGLSRSFFDFYNAAVQNYRAGYLPQEDTGDGGWWVWGYTAQFGGGLSATISAEQARSNQIIDQSVATSPIVINNPITALQAGGGAGGYGGWDVPDIVGNIRIDQAWGSAQVMGAGHEVKPLYYGPLESSGHPDTTWGWVAGVGAHLNLPFIWQGDYIEGEFNYTQGALQYLYSGQNFNLNTVHGGTGGYGVGSDCVFGGTPTIGAFGTNCELTTGWSAVLSYEHYWTPQWHQSFTGAYMQVNYDDPANNMLCALEGQGRGIGSLAVAEPGCDNNWKQWGAGSRLQWDVTKSFYLGVEVMYNKLISASSATGFVPTTVALGAPTLCGLGQCRVEDQDNWAFTIRMHKDFLP